MTRKVGLPKVPRGNKFRNRCYINVFTLETKGGIGYNAINTITGNTPGSRFGFLI